MPAEDDKQRRGGVNWRQAVTMGGLALALPWMIAVPALTGWYIDKRYDTAPLWFLVGLFLGLVGAGLDIYKLLKRFGQFK
jgi:F0F1-type ATP synthase assembly protein I